MRTVILSYLIVAFIVGVLGQGKYDSSNDDFDISEVLQNERLLNAYARCLLDKGPCTPEVKKVRDKIPEALETRCVKCTEKQKQLGKQLVHEVKNKHPQLWKELVAKYDPDGKHQQAFQDFLNS